MAVQARQSPLPRRLDALCPLASPALGARSSEDNRSRGRGTRASPTKTVVSTPPSMEPVFISALNLTVVLLYSRASLPTPPPVHVITQPWPPDAQNFYSGPVYIVSHHQSRIKTHWMECNVDPSFGP